MATRYTVVSTQRADGQLVNLWTSAAPGERALITQASDELDVILSEDAEQKGGPLSSTALNLRFLDHQPLRVYFDVSEPDRMVRIFGFQRCP